MSSLRSSVKKGTEITGSQALGARAGEFAEGGQTGDRRALDSAPVSGTEAKNRADGTLPASPQRAAPASSGAKRGRPPWLRLAVMVVIAAGAIAYGKWRSFQAPKLPPGFAGSNGRIEAIEVHVTTKLPGRIFDELVREGDFVTAGQVVAHMDISVLKAQLGEAKANIARAEISIETARSTLAQRESEKTAAESIVAEREAELDLATSEYNRTKELVGKGGLSEAQFDIKRASLHRARAALATARANVSAADAAITSARTGIIAARANVESARAAAERIQADINDSTLKAPRTGRIQYRVSQPGEVLPAGGRVLNMIDLTDVYMNFFLPEAVAGRIKIGAEVRLVLDALPQYVIPAQVSFVADIAQFTPKTVETAQERQKLAFRIRAHIAPELLRRYSRDVKAGMPGMAYVQLDREAPWPAHLQVKLPQ